MLHSFRNITVKQHGLQLHGFVELVWEEPSCRAVWKLFTTTINSIHTQIPISQYRTSVMKLFTDERASEMTHYADHPLCKYRVPQKGSFYVGCLKPFSCKITRWNCTISDVSQSNSMASNIMGLSSSYEKSLQFMQYSWEIFHFNHQSNPNSNLNFLG